MELKKFDVKAYAAKARETVAEGSVLLRNEGVLPFGKGCRVAVFGRSQFNYYKSGTGSGGLVNTAHVPTITEALEASGVVTVDGELKAVYEEWLKDHPFDVGQGCAAEPECSGSSVSEKAMFIAWSATRSRPLMRSENIMPAAAVHSPRVRRSMCDC